MNIKSSNQNALYGPMTAHRNGISMFPPCLSRLGYSFLFRLIGILFVRLWRRHARTLLGKLDRFNQSKAPIKWFQNPMTWHIRHWCDGSTQHFLKFKFNYFLFLFFRFSTPLFDSCFTICITCSYKTMEQNFCVWFSSRQRRRRRPLHHKMIQDHDFHIVCNATNDRCSFPHRQNVKAKRKKNGQMNGARVMNWLCSAVWFLHIFDICDQWPMWSSQCSVLTAEWCASKVTEKPTIGVARIAYFDTTPLN